MNQLARISTNPATTTDAAQQIQFNCTVFVIFEPISWPKYRDYIKTIQRFSITTLCFSTAVNFTLHTVRVCVSFPLRPTEFLLPYRSWLHKIDRFYFDKTFFFDRNVANQEIISSFFCFVSTY